MASTGKKGKKSKGKTISLNSFLADGKDAGGSDTTTVTIPKASWADEMDDFEGPSRQEKIVLPTAPRKARGPDIDHDRVPRDPPFTAYIANLSYDVDQDAVIDFFSHLKIKGVRLPRDGDADSGRLKGFGYADFEDRQSLIEALEMNEGMLLNRKIKIDLATNSGRGDRGGFGGGGGSRYGDREEQGEEHKSSNWRSDPPPASRDDGRSRGGFDRYEPPRDDRRGGGGYNRDRYDRNDRYGDRGGDRYGERGDRYGDRNDRYGDRGDRYGDRGGDRYGDRGGDRYGDRNGRYGDRNDRYDRRRSPEPPKERPRLQLAKRSERSDDKAGKDGAASSIFGGAKPVDTAKKEAEVEQRLQEKEQQRLKELEKQANSSGGGAAIFGGARPVDTRAREKEIEERLRKMDVKPKSESDDGRPDSRGSGEEKKKGIFGNAKPVDTTARDKEIEERLRNRDGSDREAAFYRDAARHNDGKRSEIHSDRRGHGGRGERRDSHRRDHDDRKPADRSPPPAKKVDDKPPNFVGSNKFAYLPDEEDVGSGQESN